jgi:oligosaccharyltransferase complex subunit epsilon
MKQTPQRTKLIDVFLAFLAAVGALQFIYCILAGNYVRLPLRLRRSSLSQSADLFLQPFNAFLSGFSATVGQFVLTSKLPFARHLLELDSDHSQFPCESKPPKQTSPISLLCHQRGKSHESRSKRGSSINADSDGNRAFADYVVCSLILHFFCVNFIN